MKVRLEKMITKGAGLGQSKQEQKTIRVGLSKALPVNSIRLLKSRFPMSIIIWGRCLQHDDQL